MKLSEFLSGFFSKSARHRGEDYYRIGRVHIEFGDEESVSSIVHGTERYQTHLQFDGEDLLAECSCPAFDDSGACKHLWATILAAEKLGFLSAAGKEQISYSPLDHGFESDDEPRHSTVQKSEYYSASNYYFPTAQKKEPSPPAWKSVLNGLEQSRKTNAFASGQR